MLTKKIVGKNNVIIQHIAEKWRLYSSTYQALEVLRNRFVCLSS